MAQYVHGNSRYLIAPTSTKASLVVRERGVLKQKLAIRSHIFKSPGQAIYVGPFTVPT